MSDRDMPDRGEVASYQVSAYTVFPAGYRGALEVPEREAWCLTVADAGDGWAVRWRSRCLNYRGSWLFEPPAEARTEEFLRSCRFSEQAALLRARREIDDVVVEGVTFAEHVAAFRSGQRALAREVLEAREQRDSRPKRRSAGTGERVLVG